MSVKHIVNAITGEEGYQAVVRKRTKYFSVKKFGKRTAKAKAKKAEKEMIAMLDDEFNSRIYDTTVRVNPRSKLGVSGLHVQYRVMRSGQPYPYVCATYRDELGVIKNRSCSLTMHSVRSAVKMLFKYRRKAGLINPDYEKTVEAVRKFLHTPLSNV